MDMYKKKNLKFDKNLGLGRNLRAVERSTARAESRHTRFSLLRCLDDVDSEYQPIEKNENNEAVSRIPTFGKPNLKAPMSRTEMLQKWKEEKQMKRQYELKTKKPTFKVGFVAPKPVPILSSFAKTTVQTPSKSESKMKITADSRIRFDNKFNSKTIKESGIQSSNRKIPATGSSNLKVKQESHIQLPSKPNATLLKPHISTKQIKNQETRTRMPIKSEIAPKKTSYSTTTKEVDSKLHSLSDVPKLPDSRILKPTKALHGLPRKNQTRIAEPKTSQLESGIKSSNRKTLATGSSNLKEKQEFHNQLPNKPKTTFQKPSLVSTRQIKSEQNSCRIGKAPEKTASQIKQTGIPHKNGNVPKPQSKSISKIGLPAKKKEDSPKISFRCELSHIEHTEDNSIASKGFLFQPPTDLSFSFLENGIGSIFSKLRAGTERTSTPMRADLKEIEDAGKKSSNVTDDSLKSEVSRLQIPDPANESYEFSASSPEIKVKEKEYIPVDTASDIGEEKKNYLVEQDSLQKSPDINKPQTGDKSYNITESVSEKLEIKNQGPVLNIPEINLPVFEGESPLRKDPTTFELPVYHEIDLLEKQGPANLLDGSLSVFGGKSPLLKDVITSEYSQQPKSDLPDDEVPAINPRELPEGKKSVDVKDFPNQELNLEKPNMQAPTMSLSEICSSTFKGKGPLLPIDIPSNVTKKDLLLEDDVSFITRRKTRSSEINTRSFRRSEMPPLESINESLENSSLLESPPKPRKKEPLQKPTLGNDFTPRRSLRLARLSELGSPECLFNVRPSFYATPPDLENSACSSTTLTYDFDKLHLEAPSKEINKPLVQVQQRPSTRDRKVSLLYTPPLKGRVSTVRKSIKGDLMSFSPDV